MPLSSSYQFSPVRDMAQLTEIFPFCLQYIYSPDYHTLSITLDVLKTLSAQELGRLLVLNGKCRVEGVRLTVNCGDTQFRELQSLRIDRIVWVEQKNNS